MRLIAFLIIAVSLTVGAVAATTAYVPRLNQVAPAVEAGATITLAAPAGARSPEDDSVDAAPEPIAASGTVLTPELLGTLREAGVERIRVKEFAFARWTLAWVFGLSVVGLLAGAGMVRFDRRRRLAAQAAEPAGAEGAATSPEAAIASIRNELAALQGQLAHPADANQRQHMATERLGDIQGTHIDAFLAARERLIGRHGLSGFARIMDRFSAVERQINRGWSAAADGVLEETEACIAQAIELVGEVEAVMRR